MKKIVLSIDFDPSYVVRFIGVIIGLTILMSVISIIISSSSLQHDLFGLAPKLNMDAENTIPTYISSINLFIAAGLLGFIAFTLKKTTGKHWKQWSILGLIFFFLSLDESASLHEGVSSRFNMAAGGFSGSTHYAWAILGSGLIVVFLLYFRRFIFSLPAASRNRFVISGAVFLAGAIGVEALGGLFSSQTGTETFIYQFSVIAEESLEMLGIYLFIWSLFRYVGESLLCYKEESASDYSNLRIQPQEDIKYNEYSQERA